MQHPLPPRPTLIGYAQVPDKENPEMDINKLFHPEKSTDLFDKEIENCVQLQPESLGILKCDKSSKIQRGLSWREQLKWDTCLFVSKRHNLYTEVKSIKRGPKTAVIHLGSQVGMKYTSILTMGLHKTHKDFFTQTFLFIHYIISYSIFCCKKFHAII